VNRLLIDGTTVPEIDVPIELKIKTKCPWKWKLTDMETGEQYMGHLPKEGDMDWVKV
jgi:hypothetical protein